MSPARLTLTLCSVGLLALLDGCSKTSTSPTAPTPPSTTTYVGTFADAATSGTVSLTVASSLVASSPTGSPRATGTTGATAASGTLTRIDGTTTQLGGTFDFGTGALSVSGGGVTLAGMQLNNVLKGTLSATSGTGVFTSLPTPSTGGAPRVFCGTYISDDDGWFNLVISPSGVLAGVSHPTTSNGSSVTLTGTLSGSTLSIVTSANVPLQGKVATDGTSLSGTFTATSGKPGSFQASTASCGSTSSGGTSSVAGSWADLAGGQTHLRATLLQTGTTVSGIAILTVPPCPGTGGLFTITSGSFAGGTVTFLGSGVDSGASTVVGFSGTLSTATTMTGTLTHTVCGSTVLIPGFALTRQ